MLHKPDVHTTRLLALSELLAESTNYDQNRWESCVCAHARRLDKSLIASFGYESVGRYLGLSNIQTAKLFAEVHHPTPTRETAAKVVRHLALTGEVKWDV